MYKCSTNVLCLLGNQTIIYCFLSVLQPECSVDDSPEASEDDSAEDESSGGGENSVDESAENPGMGRIPILSKHEALSQSCFNARSASQTVGQHYYDTGFMLRVCLVLVLPGTFIALNTFQTE